MFISKHLALVFACAVLCIASGCSSSSKSNSTSGGGNSGNSTGLQFTAPTSTPTIEAGQTVSLAVNESVTWTLEPGNGFGKCSAQSGNCGSFTSQTSTSATYVAPGTELNDVPPCPGLATSGPSKPLQVVIVATSTSDASVSSTIPLIIIQSPPCIATIPSITVTTAAGSQTYPSSQGNPLCPPAGSVIPYVAATNTSGVDPFQVGVFNQLSIYEGGGNSDPFTPFGVGPFTWTTTGTIPSGLTISPSSNGGGMVISGTPVSAGCSTFGVQITDATGVSSSATLSLVVVPPPLSVQVPVLPSVFVNAAQTAGIPYAPTALVALGGVPPYSWAYNPNPQGNQINGLGTLPPGLCISSSASDIPVGCASSSAPASSNLGLLWGTPQPADVTQPAPTAYTAPLQINDSQQPYPAVGQPYVNFTADIQPTFCSPADQPVSPTVLNGGGTVTNPVSANAYLQGSFAFLLRGFDANGPVVIAGSVTFSGDDLGTITGGEEDISRSGGSQNVTIVPTGSSYAIGGLVNGSSSPTGSFNRGCMTLLNSAGTTTTFAFSLGGCSNHFAEGGLAFTSDSACGMMQNSQQQNVPAGFYTTGRIMEFDDATGAGTRASGILRAQDTSSFSAGLTGPYAFGLSGWDSTGGHYAMAGSMQTGSGTLSSAAADIDDAGTLAPQLTGGSGTYTSLDANGRATGQLTVGSASYDLALYLVGGSEAILLTTDTLSANHPIISGEALTTATSFTNASIQNSHIFHIGGVAPTGPDVSVGVLSFDGIGTLSGTVYENQASTLGTTAVSGVYLVDSSTGRTAFTTPQQGQTLGSHSWVAYIIPPAANVTRLNCSTSANCVTGFLVGTDSTAQDGVTEFQTSAAPPPPPFNNQYMEADYIYGTDEALAATAPHFEGDVYLRPSTASKSAGSLGPTNGLAATSPPFVFVQDSSYGSITYCLQPNCQLLFPDEPFTGSYSVSSSGTGTFGGGTASVTNGNVIFYIDESPVNLTPSVVVVEQ